MLLWLLTVMVLVMVLVRDQKKKKKKKKKSSIIGDIYVRTGIYIMKASNVRIIMSI